MSCVYINRRVKPRSTSEAILGRQYCPNPSIQPSKLRSLGCIDRRGPYWRPLTASSVFLILLLTSGLWARWSRDTRVRACRGTSGALASPWAPPEGTSQTARQCSPRSAWHYEKTQSKVRSCLLDYGTALEACIDYVQTGYPLKLHFQIPRVFSFFSPCPTVHFPCANLRHLWQTYQT